MCEDYVSYELAVKLKSCGFDEPCQCFYGDKVLKKNCSRGNFNAQRTAPWEDPYIEICSAPLLYQAQKWLREKWGIDVCVWRSFSVCRGYHYQFVKDKNWENGIVQYVCAGRNYEQSLAGAISAALELIKKGE